MTRENVASSLFAAGNLRNRVAPWVLTSLYQYKNDWVRDAVLFDQVALLLERAGVRNPSPAEIESALVTLCVSGLVQRRTWGGQVAYALSPKGDEVARQLKPVSAARG